MTLHKGASHYASVMRKMVRQVHSVPRPCLKMSVSSMLGPSWHPSVCSQAVWQPSCSLVQRHQAQIDCTVQGVNLDRCQHQLVVLDPLVDALSSDTTLSCDLGALSTAIQQACSQACSPHSAPSTTVTPGTVILIDSASGLAALHGSAGGAWLDFLRATVQLVSQNLDRIALAVVAHMDAAQDAPWIGWLAAAADCVVTVDPLPTGLAGDVNVKVSLFRPNRWGCAFGLPQQRTDMLNVEVQSTCFGSVTERSVQFRHSSTA